MSLQKYKVITSRRFRGSGWHGSARLVRDGSSFIDDYTTLSHDYSPKTPIMHLILPDGQHEKGLSLNSIRSTRSRYRSRGGPARPPSPRRLRRARRPAARPARRRALACNHNNPTSHVYIAHHAIITYTDRSALRIKQKQLGIPFALTVILKITNKHLHRCSCYNNLHH